jgi:hypothetical protein
MLIWFGRCASMPHGLCGTRHREEGKERTVVTYCL